MSSTELTELSDDTRDPADHAWNAAIKYVIRCSKLLL